MLKNPKERLLAITLFSVVGLSAGHDLVDKTLFGPMQRKEQKIKALSQSIQDSEMEYRRISHAQRILEESRLHSLPPDPAIATAYYQAWLVKASGAAGVSNAQVVAGRPSAAEPAGYRIPFTVQADMSTSQLGMLLDEIRKQPLLHNVRHVTVTSPGGSHPTGLQSVTIGIEALSMADANSRETLLDPEAEGQPLETPNLNMAQFLTAKNLFTPGYLGPPKPRSTAPVQRPTSTVAPTPPTQYEFIAGIMVNGKPEAWLYDRRTRIQKTLYEHTPTQLGNLSIEVKEIWSDQLVLDVNGKETILDLGGTLVDTPSRQVSQR